MNQLTNSAGTSDWLVRSQGMTLVAHVPGTSSTVSVRQPGRLAALTEDILTLEQVFELEERLRNPQLFPARTPQQVPVGRGQFLLQPA